MSFQNHANIRVNTTFFINFLWLCHILAKFIILSKTIVDSSLIKFKPQASMFLRKKVLN